MTEGNAERLLGFSEHPGRRHEIRLRSDINGQAEQLTENERFLISDGFTRTALRFAEPGESRETDTVQGFDIFNLRPNEYVFFYQRPYHVPADESVDKQRRTIVTTYDGPQLAGRVIVEKGKQKGQVEVVLIDAIKL